jgi:cytochrome P450
MLSSLLLSYVLDRLFLYQALATLTTMFVVRVLFLFRVRLKRYQLFRLYGIPGPEPRLLDGSLFLFLDTKTPFLNDVEFQRKYGKVYGLFIGDEPNVIVTDLELLRKIFFEHPNVFRERTPTFIDTPLAKSVLLARHHRWKQMRKIISPTFSTFTMRGQESTNFIDEVVKLMLDYIEDKFDAQERSAATSQGDTTHHPTRVTFDLHSLLKATALRLITGLAINLDTKVMENEPHVDSLDSFLSSLSGGVVIMGIRFPFLRPLISFLATHVEQGKIFGSIRGELNKTIDEGLKELACSKKLSPNRPQLINTFIRLHHEGKLTREEIIGNCEAILFAGYDTTSTTLVYIFWVLGKHQAIQDKLRSELMAHGIDSKYLEQVINETMRLYPTVLTFTSRVATENVKIDHLELPSGSKVIYEAWLMYRDPELWPEPDKFDPERFREGVQIHPCAFAPFGMSERKCLGYSLAKLELKMVVCDVLCRYKVFTKAPDNLGLHVYATVLSKPSEKVVVELEKV